MKKEKFLAIIPARKGSKRLPNKNILELGGKPLIAWTIEAAVQAQTDKVIVSTDSREIAKISEKYGAEVPFIRPGNLSTDTASSVDVVLHTLDFFKNKGILFEYIVLLQPTSPLRTAIDIDKAIKFLYQNNANSVTSVCEMEHSPLWCNTLPENGAMDDFIRPEVQGKRSQDLDTFYRLNGAIYIVKADYFETERKFVASSNSFAHIMSKESSVDIDDKLDFLIAEQMLKKLDK